MDYAWFVLLGLAVGLAGTLIGIGGGFILVPLFLALHPEWTAGQLTAVSLFAILCNAASGTVGYARMKRIDYRSGIIFAIATVPGSVLGTKLGSSASKATFSVVLGGVMIAVAGLLFLRTLLAKPKEHGDGPARQPQTVGQRVTGVAISLGVGVVATFCGIGGGIIHVPALIYLLHFPVHVATATSHFVLAVTAAVAVATHAAQGDYGGLWPIALSLGAGAVVGAQFGAKLSSKARGTFIVRGLALAMVAVGARLVWYGLQKR